MKKLILLLILTIGFISCTYSDVKTKGDYSINSEIIDSCEYIIYDGSYSGGIIHKENCKFCKTKTITDSIRKP